MKIVQATRAAAAVGWETFKSVLTTAQLHASQWFAGLTATWGQVSFDALSRRAYRNPTAARALRLVAQLMADLPFVVKVRTGGGGEMTDQHDMMRLLTRPNPRTGKGLLFSEIVTHLYCAGEIFIRRVAPTSGPNRGKPTASGGSITLLHPGRFSDFIRDGAQEITGYRFSDRHGRQEEYGLDEILHIRIYNPQDDERGMPLLLGASRAIDQQEAADEWNKGLAQGGGRTPGYLAPVLEKGQQLTAEQQASAQERNDKVTLDRQRRNLPQVLSGAFEFRSASMTLKDADFLKAGQQNSRHIAAVIGIPATLLGDEKAGSLTDAGVNSEMRAAYLFTVLPLAEYVLGEINAWLSPLYGGAELTYDRDQIDVLNEDVNLLYTRLSVATGGKDFLTREEAREAIGYKPKPEVGEFAPPTTQEPPTGGDGAPLPAKGVWLDPVDGVRAALRARYSGVN